MVPLRFIAEQLGLNVEYDEEMQRKNLFLSLSFIQITLKLHLFLFIQNLKRSNYWLIYYLLNINIPIFQKQNS